MSSVPKLDLGLEQAKIAAVRQEWVQAVRDGNADRLGDLTTDGVVAVLKDGRCVNGKEALRTTLQHIFSLYDVERRTLASGVIIRDNWAIELDEMDSAITPVSSGMEVRAHVKAVIVYARPEQRRLESRPPHGIARLTLVDQATFPKAKRSMVGSPYSL